MKNIVLTGTGSFMPDRVVKNDYFLNQDFYDEKNQKFETDNETIIKKFEEITGIRERRWIDDDMNTDDMGFIAADRAITDSGLDKEKLDYIIVGQNAGQVIKGSNQSDMIPSIASRVKQKLGIRNKYTVAYDLLFGCPGWLQGVIHMYGFMKAGMANKAMVIGVDALSRIIDPYDRDSMIFADGAGATVFEVKEEREKRGILSYSVVSDTFVEADYLYMDKSYNLDHKSNARYIKMMGRKIYEYSLINVPAAMKEALDKSGVGIEEVKKVFIHQANEKMDDAIIKRFFRLYNIRKVDPMMMPMSINTLGNSSVATIPTLIDLVRKKKCRKNHEINDGDVILFASVGAGMNINAVVYKF